MNERRFAITSQKIIKEILSFLNFVDFGDSSSEFTKKEYLDNL